MWLYLSYRGQINAKAGGKTQKESACNLTACAEALQCAEVREFKKKGKFKQHLLSLRVTQLASDETGVLLCKSRIKQNSGMRFRVQHLIDICIPHSQREAENANQAELTFAAAQE